MPHLHFEVAVYQSYCKRTFLLYHALVMREESQFAYLLFRLFNTVAKINTKFGNFSSVKLKIIFFIFYLLFLIDFLNNIIKIILESFIGRLNLLFSYLFILSFFIDFIDYSFIY